MPRKEEFRGKLKETRTKKRKEKKTFPLTANCTSGTVRGSNELLAMITCSMRCRVRRARLFAPDVGDNWAYKILLSEGASFQTVDGPKPIKPGFIDLGDVDLEPHHILVIRAIYSGDEGREDFEYSLDYFTQVKEDG